MEAAVCYLIFEELSSYALGLKCAYTHLLSHFSEAEGTTELRCKPEEDCQKYIRSLSPQKKQKKVWKSFFTSHEQEPAKMSRSVEAVQTFGKKVMAETCTCIHEGE